MKNRWQPLIALLLLVLASLACLPLTPAQPAAPAEVAPAQLELEQSRVWHTASGNAETEVKSPITAKKGDLIRTDATGIALLRWTDLIFKIYFDKAELRIEDLSPVGTNLLLKLGTILCDFAPEDPRVTKVNVGGLAVAQITGTMVMLSYLPDAEIAVVRVFDGEVVVTPLTGTGTPVTAVAGDWVLVDGDRQPVVSSRLFDMRKLARALGTWDVFSQVEQDVYAGFGLTSASEVPASEMLIVFGEVPAITPSRTPTHTPTPTHSPTRTPSRTPTRTPTHTPTPIACRPGVLYCADFESGRADGWQRDPGWRVTQEGTNHVLRGEGHFFATYIGSTWSDFRVTFRLKLVQGVVHLNYRVTRSPWSRYFFGYEATELNLTRQSRETFTDIERVNTRFSLGVWHDVEIVGWGGHLRIFVDGRMEMEVVDENPLTRGSFAFETLDNSIALVDDIEIRNSGSEPAVEEAGPAAAAPAEPRPVEPVTPRCEVVSASLNIRSGPGTNYPTLRSALPRGTALVPLGRVQNNSWIRVQVAGSSTVGWVSAAGQYISCTVAIGSLDLAAAPPVPVAEAPVEIATERPPPSIPISCSANPSTITQGECSTLDWAIDNVRAVHLDGAPVTGHETRRVCPDASQSYTLRITTGSGERTCVMRVTVTPRPSSPAPDSVKITCRAEPSAVPAGGCSTISWNIEGVKDIHLDGAPVIGYDSRSVCPSSTQTYTLRINTGDGERFCSMTVTVGQDSAPPVITLLAPENWCADGQIALNVSDASPPLDVQAHFVNKTTLYRFSSDMPKRDWPFEAAGGSRYALDFGSYSRTDDAGTTVSATDRLGYASEITLPDFECGSGGLEYGIDRPGGDIRGFVIAAEVASPERCEEACFDEPDCLAFTYAAPDVFDTNARCWIKSDFRDAVNNSCCISALKASWAYAWSPSVPDFEYDTDRQGMDYVPAYVYSGIDDTCRDRCIADPRCRAFTVCPTHEREFELSCWLKEGIPAASYKDGCISGYK